MSRVLVTTDYLAPGDEVDTLLRRHGHEVIHRPAEAPRHPEETHALFDGVHGAIIASEPVTADMIATATELQVIARSGVGYDSVDLNAATGHGIRVCNTPGVNHDAVAEMTIALMLMAARRLPAVIDGVRAGADGRVTPEGNYAEPRWESSASGRAVAPSPKSQPLSV